MLSENFSHQNVKKKERKKSELNTNIVILLIFKTYIETYLFNFHIISK